MNVLRGPYATTPPSAVPDANRCPTCGAYHPVASLAREHCQRVCPACGTRHGGGKLSDLCVRCLTRAILNGQRGTPSDGAA